MLASHIDGLQELVFVFGSNELGIHGKGAAKDAKDYWGARSGQGNGLAGASYAIATKPHPSAPALPIWMIRHAVDEFLAFAEQREWIDFQVTRIGCGESGYSDKDIAPLFARAAPNVHLPIGWRTYAT